VEFSTCEVYNQTPANMQKRKELLSASTGHGTIKDILNYSMIGGKTKKFTI
jgi:hypothetical protein